MSPKNATIDEVLEAIKAQDVQTERRFGKVVQKFTANTEQRFGEVLEAVHLLSEQMEQRFKKVESQMVTKTFLDDKLADVQANLILFTRKEDSKLLALVDLLYGKRLMTKLDRKHIMALEPFAQTH
jgi:hypothetical protein